MAGPYTFADLKAALYTAADPAYLEPMFRAPYGFGKELFEQLIVVYQRVDEAINRTLQALYIQPYSGQSAPPAMGPSRTTLEVEIRRTNNAQIALTLGAGAVLFEEQSPDWSSVGGIQVRSGRQYTLTRDVTFVPGESGPITAEVTSLRYGYGYANPLPGTIGPIYQAGATFSNTQASIVQGPSTARLIVRPVPDVVTPDHVGQYVLLTAGANAGQVCRIVGYEPADSTVPHGGVAVLAGTFVARSTVVAPVGTFQIGETVTQTDAVGPTIIAQGVVLAVSAASPWYIVIETQSGQFRTVAGTIGPITGLLSGATFTTDAPPPVDAGIIRIGKLVNENGTCAWRILDWAKELGVVVRNTGENVTPGAYPMLDAIGEERGIYRAPGEPDESFRLRVAAIADVVSPNAIRRIGNRIWSQYGGVVCLREVGYPLFPGVYPDAAPGAPSDLSKYAYDLDGLKMRGVKTGEFVDGERVVQNNGGILATARVTTTRDAAPVGAPVPPVDPLYLEVAAVRGGFVINAPIVGELSGATFVPNAILYELRPVDRFKLNLNYTEFRAFFLLGVPPPVLGEFGIPYDAPHPYNAFDAAPYLTFSDGYPVTSATLNQATWQAVDGARAGGVGFDLYPETIGCI
jgi:hypothetical protein